MKSTFTLRFANPDLERRYALKRCKDINIIALWVFVLRMLTVLVGIILNIIEGTSLTVLYWVIIGLIQGWQLLLLLLSFKWPLIFSKY